MTMLTNALLLFLVMLPFFITGVLAVFMVDGVLKYEVKHKLVIYISLACFGAVVGAVEALIGAKNEDGIVFINEFVTLIIYGVTVVVLAVNIKAKWWKRIIVSFLAIDILISVDQVFEHIREVLFDASFFGGGLQGLIVNILFLFLIQLLEFAFLYLLKRLRSKNDNTPLPILVMLTIAVLLNVFVTIFPDLLTDYSSNDNRVITILSMVVTLMFLALFFYIRVTRKERDDLKNMNHINEELVASLNRLLNLTTRFVRCVTT